MIFDASAIEALTAEPKKDKDILIEIPAGTLSQDEVSSPKNFEAYIKELISDSRNRIHLHDLVTAEIRKTMSRLSSDSFSVQDRDISPNAILNRLKLYESSLRELVTIVVLIARWGTREHRSILELVFARMSDFDTVPGSPILWLGLRWYPAMLLMYAGGMAALAADDYKNLATVMTTPVGTKHSDDKTQPVVARITEALLDVERANGFKSLPGHEQQYVPRSEYLFKILQPMLEDILFLGTSYERLFVRFEVIYALIVADLRYNEGDSRVWGPPGRFCWKYERDGGPFAEVVRDAERLDERWPPIMAGLFRGSYPRFVTIASEYKKILANLNWW